MEYSYVMVCVTTREPMLPSPGGVMRTCRECKASVWYNPKGDPLYGQGLAEFECTACIAERYQREDLPPPEVHEITRQHLISLGMSNTQIEEALFAITVQLLGGKKRL